MLSPRLRFVLALALALTSIVFIGVTLNAAKAREEAEIAQNPLKARLLRRKDKIKDTANAGEVAELRRQANPQDTPEERKFEDNIPKHVPIRFKLKAEKEKKFKDLKNPDWYRDFELEVTNTSDKPIYYLDIDLVYPEIESGIGGPVIVPLRYGRMDFIDHHTTPLLTDVPIQPGETFTFSIPERDRTGWEWHKKHQNIPDPKTVILQFSALSFGDGTGYDTLHAVPYPYRRNRSAALPCRAGPLSVVAKGGGLNNRPLAFDSSVRERSLLDITGKYSAGYFFVGPARYYFLKDPSVRVDSCCGSECNFMKPITESCSCGWSQGNSYPDCTDPDGLCGTPRRGGRFCDQFGVACPEFFRDVCVGDVPTPPPTPSPNPTPGVPTPTQTPTPEPTCDPATKPNNSNCNTCLPSLFPGEQVVLLLFCPP